MVNAAHASDSPENAAREMGIETVGVYAEPDRNSLHVSQALSDMCPSRLCPEASVGGFSERTSYLWRRALRLGVAILAADPDRRRRKEL